MHLDRAIDDPEVLLDDLAAGLGNVVGAGFERREDVATGEETSDTRGFLSWRYDWGR